MSEIPNLFLLIDETQDISNINLANLSNLNKWDPDASDHMSLWPLILKKPHLEWNWNTLSRNRSIREKYVIPLRQKLNWEILSTNLSISMQFIAENKLLPWDLTKISQRIDYDYNLLYEKLTEDEKKGFPIKPRIDGYPKDQNGLIYHTFLDKIEKLKMGRFNMSGFCNHNDSLVLPIPVGDYNYGKLEYYEYHGMTDFERAKYKCRRIKQYEPKDYNLGDNSHSIFANSQQYDVKWKAIAYLWDVIKIMALNFDKDGKIISSHDQKNEDCQSNDITVHTKRLNRMQTIINSICERLSAMENTPHEVIRPGEFDASLRDLLFKLPNKEWDFAALSRNRNINDEILLKFIDKPWNFAELSRNRNVSITFIITYAHFAWDWTEISSRPDITAAIVLEHADKPWDFAALSKIL